MFRALPPPKEDAISPKIASAPVDLVGERRRAKALKLLDAKMAELAREPEGWDDVAVGSLSSSWVLSILLSDVVIDGVGRDRGQ